jgi:hypothetical protein
MPKYEVESARPRAMDAGREQAITMYPPPFGCACVFAIEVEDIDTRGLPGRNTDQRAGISPPQLPNFLGIASGILEAVRCRRPLVSEAGETQPTFVAESEGGGKCSGDFERCHVASASLVERIGGPSRDHAHSSVSPHRYNGFRPHLRKGGPPPRVALVASVAADVLYPAAVSACAASRRPNSVSGSCGIGATLGVLLSNASSWVVVTICLHLRAMA